MINSCREKRTLLNWYKVLGVDVLFYSLPDEIKLNKIDKQRPFSMPPDSCRSNNVFVPTDACRKSIDEINELSALYEEIRKIDCPIKRTARNIVISDGDPKSKIMLIGEAPGYDEDLQGKPFVGQSGILLNKMLNSVGINREDVFITNVCYWRPPGNRNPSPDEISLCLPYVKHLIKLVNPKVIMLLGSVATHALLDTMQPISKLRGRLVDVMGIKTIPTYHPAYLLRSPVQKKFAYDDLKLLAQCYKS